MHEESDERMKRKTCVSRFIPARSMPHVAGCISKKFEQPVSLWLGLCIYSLHAAQQEATQQPRDFKHCVLSAASER